MTHTALCQSVHRPCRVARYLGFLFPISIAPYLVRTCRTVLIPCYDRVAMDRLRSHFSRSRHNTCGKQSCMCEMKYGGVSVCACVCLKSGLHYDRPLNKGLGHAVRKCGVVLSSMVLSHKKFRGNDRIIL